MDLSTVNVALLVLDGLLCVAMLALSIACISLRRQYKHAGSQKPAWLNIEAATTKQTLDLEQQKNCSDVQSPRRPGFTLIDTHGNKHFNETEAGRKAWLDLKNQPPVPLFSTPRLQGDWDLSFLISKPEGIAPSICSHVAPPVGQMGDAIMEVLKHDGQDQMCVRLKLGPPKEVEEGGFAWTYWGRSGHNAVEVN